MKRHRDRLFRYRRAARVVFACFMCLATLLAPPTLGAQCPTAMQVHLPAVFLDCQSCDDIYVRTQVPWISYARDRADADVYVLVTTQKTGDGGTAYTVNFFGVGRFGGIDNTLQYTVGPTATSDEIRREFVRVFQLGLVRYATASPVGRALQIVYASTGAGVPKPDAASDPWHSWVFSVGASASVNSEQSTSSVWTSYALSVSQVTPALKVRLALQGSYGRQRYTFVDSSSVSSRSRSYGADVGVVKSLGAHWSAGQLASLSSSTFLNERTLARVAAAAEYDVVPYAEWTRRRLTLQYSVGANRFAFYDTTLYGKIDETRGDQRLVVDWNEVQPWGSVSVSVEGAAYLNDFRQQHATVVPELNLRVTRGVTFHVFGSLKLLRDQIYLSRQGLSNEDVLLNQRQLASSYSYYMSAGFSYSFGSKFANVVNPRLGPIAGS